MLALSKSKEPEHAVTTASVTVTWIESTALRQEEGLPLVALNLTQKVPAVLKVYDEVRPVLNMTPGVMYHWYETELAAVPVKFTEAPLRILGFTEGLVIWAESGAGQGVEQLRQPSKLYLTLVRKYFILLYWPAVNCV